MASHRRKRITEGVRKVLPFFSQSSSPDDKDDTDDISITLDKRDEVWFGKRKKDFKDADTVSNFSFYSFKIDNLAPPATPRENFFRWRYNLSKQPSQVTLAEIPLREDSEVVLPRRSQSSPIKRYSAQLWIETLSPGKYKTLKESLTHVELARQEAIHELLQGEKDLLDDLHLLQETYYQSLSRLKLLSSEDLDIIFRSFHKLLPFHADLIKKLQELRNEDGITHNVGSVLLSWSVELEDIYTEYCVAQVEAKMLLKEKKQNNEKLQDFLQRCIESKFSRRLDLETFLDLPRNRLVRYSLLLNAIAKKTSGNNEDQDCLLRAIHIIETSIKNIEAKVGEAECDFLLKGLNFKNYENTYQLVKNATGILCSGILKHKGTKLHCFLLNTGLVLTQEVSKGSSIKYQVHCNPIQATDLAAEDLGGNTVGMLKYAFSSNGPEKNIFKVFSKRDKEKRSFILQAVCEYDKQQWLKKIGEIVLAANKQVSPEINEPTSASSFFSK